MALTAEQQKFVDITNTNVLLSASAGSGKTTTMVQKLIKLIVEDRVPVRNMLVLTFTKSAASEMRQKLYLKLTEVASNSNDQFLVDQLEDINLADIGTIDSICKKLITKYFYAIDIDPSFVQLDEKENNYLLNKCIDKVFEMLISKNDNDFFTLYESYLTKRSTRVLKDMVKSLYEFLIVKPNVEEWINFVINECYNEDVDFNYCAKYLLSFYQSSVSNFVEQFERALAMCPTEDKYKAYRIYLEERLGLCKEFVNASTYLQAVGIMSRELSAKPRTKIDVEFKEFVDVLHDEFKTLYLKLQVAFAPFNSEAFSKTKQNIITLFNVEKLLLQEYDNIKKQMGALNFSDLEHKALEILQNPNIAKQLQDYYKFVFVDEYQDINELQDKIILTLSNNNLNLIGDVKQSIYEFRQSTPQLFVDKYNAYEKGAGQVVNLNHNFRSDDNILQFVNSIFDVLITPQTLGLDYKKVSRLQAGGDKLSNYDNVGITLVDGEDVEDKIQSEVDVVVDKIYKLVQKGYNYKDIAVILRNRGELAQAIYNKLKDLSVPVRVDYRTNIFATNEVQVLYSILKVINNIQDDISLATLLVSPLYSMTEEELVQIRLSAPAEPFHMAVSAYNINDEIKEKINKVLNDINIWQHYLINHSVLECIQKVMLDFDLKNHYLSMPDGLEKVANIEQFLSILSMGDNLVDIIDYINQFQGENYQINIVPNTKNCITITTIHSSKGLEYKCVILAGLGGTIRQETDSKINISKKFGIGLKFMDTEKRLMGDVFVKSACLLDKQKGIIEEEIRLLYVALTRAKEQLELVGIYPIKKILIRSAKNIYSSTTLLDLIFKSVPNMYLNHFENNKQFDLYKGEHSHAKVEIYDKVESTNMEMPVIELTKPNKDLVRKLSTYFAYKYPYASHQNIAIKNSVTSILMEQSDYENIVESSANLQIDNVPNMDGLELGTAYHLVMQHVDYFSDCFDALNLINKLVTEGVLSVELTSKIDALAINNAVKAVKGLINAKSQVFKEQQFIMKGKHKDFVNNGSELDVIVQGVIDLALISNGQAIIIDFKTNKTSAKHLINTYAKQLSLYSVAFEKAKKVKVTQKLLYSFYLQKFVSCD